MSEQTVLVQSVELKEGVSQKTGKPYRRVLLTDGNGNQHSSFEIGIYEIAKQYEGKKAVIDAIPNGKFSDLLSVKPAEEEKPALGTGEYVRGQTAPADKASIARSVALKAAVDSTGESATPKAAYVKVIPLAEAYLAWLEGNPKVAAPDMPEGDEDIPF